MITTYRAQMGTTATTAVFRFQALETVVADTIVNLFYKGAPLGSFKVSTAGHDAHTPVLTLQKVSVNPNIANATVAGVVIEE
jgi:hypothetical protein